MLIMQQPANISCTRTCQSFILLAVESAGSSAKDALDLLHDLTSEDAPDLKQRSPYPTGDYVRQPLFASKD